MGVGDDIAPRFTQKPVLKQEDGGKRLVFQCTLEASPKPSIQWFQGTTPVPESDRIRMRVESAGGSKYNIMMDIIGVTQADAGAYKVVAKNKLGEVSASINLNFGAKQGQKQQDGIAPNFIQKPVTKQADNGRKLLFECQLTADPAPEITWFRDDTLIKAGDRIKITTSPQDQKKYFIVLEIDGVNAKDAGNYRVTAKNALGESNATIRLNFDSEEKKAQGQKPIFTQKPVIKQAGDKIVFECKLSADPKPTIVWYQGTKIIKDGGRHKTTVSANKNDYTVCLEIANPAKEDGGEYKAVAKNTLGESTATITLNFEVTKTKSICVMMEGKKAAAPEGKAPHFLQKPSIKQEKAMLVMTCNLEAKPIPKIRWFRETQEISDGGRYSVTLTPVTGVSDSYTAMLQIKDPQTEDGGSYKCTAANDLGESNANITLNFQGGAKPKPAGTAPTFTDKPVVNQENKNLSIECNCTANPKPIVTWFKDGRIITQNFRYKMRTTNKGDEHQLFLDVMSFTAKDSGQYKVTAKNDHGEGNATVTVNLEGLKKRPKEAPPMMKGPPSIKLEDGGKRLVMEIKVASASKPTAMWYFGNKPIKSGGRYFLDMAHENDCYFSVMEITNPSDLDSGDYKCVLKNPGGEATATAKVNFKALQPKTQVEGPKFSQKLSPKNVIDGDAVDLIAKVTGTEPITVTWIKDNKPLAASDVYKISYDKGTCRLYFPEVYPEDAGNYQVEVKNTAGSAMCMASLSVKDNPQQDQKDKKDKKEEDPKAKQPEAKPAPQIKEPEQQESKVQPPAIIEPGDNKAKKAEEIDGGPNTDDGYEADDDRPNIPLIMMEDYEQTSAAKQDDGYEPEGPKKIQKPIKVDGPTHTFANKLENQVIVEGDPIQVDLEINVQDGAASPVVRFMKGKREMKNDSRTNIVQGKASAKFVMQKSRFADEAKYTAQLMQDGVKVDEITWSVFVKDPKDSSLDFRNLLKHRQKKKKDSSEEDPDWGNLKPDGNFDKKRRPSQIEMMKANLKKIEKTGSDSEDEKPGSQTSSRRGSLLIDKVERTAFESVSMAQKRASVESLTIEQATSTMKMTKRASVETVEVEQSKLKIGKGKIPAAEAEEETVTLKKVPKQEATSKKTSVGAEEDSGPSGPFLKPKRSLIPGDAESQTGPFVKLKKSSISKLELEEKTSGDKGQKTDKKKKESTTEQAQQMFGVTLKGRKGKDQDEGIVDFGVHLKSFGKHKEPDKFLEDLEDIKTMEGEKMVHFTCGFCKPNAMVKWFKNKLEIFNGHKYHFENEDQEYILDIQNVKLEDAGKYTLECNGIKSSAWLYVEAKEPEYDFTQKLPAKYEITRMKDGVLECFVSDPRAKVKWFKNGEPIEYTPGKLEIQRRENRCMLKIINANSDDEADYTCTCGDASTFCKLAVTEPEWDFMKKLDDIEAMERDKCYFECDVSDPEAEVKWYKGKSDKELPSGGKYEIIKDGMKRRLVIKNCSMKDGGKYTCKVLTKETTGELFIEPDIKFFKKLEDKKEKEKGTLILECKASNPHNQPVQWLLNGKPVDKDDSRVEITKKGEQNKMVIKNLKQEDSGQYTCQVGERPCRCNVTVDELPKPPKVDPAFIPEEIVVKRGETIAMAIPFVGTPKPFASWKKDGTGLSEADTDIETADKVAKLNIPNAQRTDTGGYELTLTNEVGTEVIPINVRVLDVPGRPQGPLDVVDVYCDRCALLWDHPKEDGGCPIKHYIVEMKDADKDAWEQVCTTEDLEIDVSDLKPGHRYQFRVKAVNEQGVSEPLTADGEIIAKDPWDPSDPPGEPSILDYDKDYVELAWAPPKNDGGAPIEKYVIEKREKGKDKWDKGVEVPGSDCQGTVEGLVEGKDYEFRIMAKNKGGLSEPSVVSPPVTTKARRVKPRIMDKDKLMQVRVKAPKEFAIALEYVGEPVPEVKWTRKLLADLKKKDDKTETVESGGDVVVNNSVPKKSNITYKQTVRKDTGMYTCTVGNKHGSDSVTVEVVVLSPPTRPEGPLAVKDVTKDSVTLEWKAPKDNGGNDVKGYKVEKYDTKKGRWEPVKDLVKGTSLTVPKLQEGHDYKFRVVAVSDNGESEPLETEEPVTAKNPFDEPFPPGQPQVADQNRDHITIKWEPPESDGGNPIQGYNVERKEPKSNRWVKVNRDPVKDLEFEDAKVVDGKEYEYRVMAVNEAGTSEPSVASKPICAKPTKEAPKVNLDALYGAKEIRVRAGEPLNIKLGISGAPTPTVTWQKDGRPLTPRAGTSNNEDSAKLNVPKAERGDTGKYTVTVSNESGTHSADIPVVVLDAPGAPEGPLDVSDVFAESCLLSWKKPEDNGGADVTDYIVEKCEEGSTTWEKVPGIVKGTSHPIKGLKEGKKYKFRVKAENMYGVSEPLETTKPTLAKNPYDTPDAPRDVQIPKYDRRSADLTWKAPDNDGGNPIKGYMVEKKPRGGEWIQVNNFPVKDTSYSVMNLQEGQELEFRVMAINDGGLGKPSKATPSHLVRDQVFAAGAPSAPNVDKITKNSVDLSWKKPSNDGGGKITGYIVEKKKAGEDWKECAEVAGTSCTVPNLNEGDEVQFRVTPVNAFGPGEASHPTSVIKVENQPEKPSMDMSGVKDVNVKAGQTITIKIPFTGFPKPTAAWVNGDTDIEDDSRTDLKVKDDHVLLTTTNAKRSDAGRYKVTLKNASGTESASLGVKVLDKPAAPTGPLTASNINGDELTLKWNPPKDDGGEPINNYVVEKRVDGTDRWMKVSSFLTTPRCVVRNLDPGTKYEFRVMAENNMGVSDALVTDEAILAKLPFDTPSAPGTPKCTGTTEDSISLSWTPPRRDGGNPIRGYVVEKREKGDDKWTKATYGEVLDNECTCKGLQDGKEYEFRVAAVNEAGPGDFAMTSDAIMARAPPVAPKISPDYVPRDVIAKAGEEFKIVIPYIGNPTPKTTWSLSGASVLEDSRIKFINDPLEVKLVNKSAKKSDAGKYNIMLQNEKGFDSLYVNVIVVDSPGKPEGPLEVNDITPDSCKLTWYPPRDDGGSPITNYRIEKMDKKYGNWDSVTKYARGTSFEVMDLVEGHEYCFRVMAENEHGVSEPLETATSVIAQHPYTAPDSPGKPTVEDVDEDSVTLSWTKPKSDGGKKILGYVVEYLDPYSGRWKAANDLPCSDTNFTVPGLKRDKEYEFRVRAKNVAGLGEPSAVIGPVIPKPKYGKSGAPGTPVPSAIGRTYIDLKWEPPKNDGGSKVTGYVIEKKPKNSDTWTKANNFNVREPYFTINDLPEGEEFEFRVAAITAAGVGEYSLNTAPIKIKEPIVGSAAEFTKKLYNEKAPLGGEVTFSVQTHGKPLPEVSWYKNGVPIGNTSRTKLTQNDDNFLFTLSDVGESDAGEIRCEISNNLGRESCSCQLAVMSPPRMEKSLPDKQVELGDQFKIKVPFSGTGPFEVSVLKDGRELKEGGRVKITEFDDYVVLVLKESVEDDTGGYQVKVSNPSGAASTSFKLGVVSPPGSPSGPLAVSEITKSTCSLSWKPPRELGGGKLSHYVVERQEIGKPYWVTVSSRCKDTKQDVQGLVENHQYLFRVSAVNEFGQSEPLKAENPIVAKMPFDAPGSPGVPEVTQVGGDFASLTWAKPHSDGGGRILGYWIDKKEHRTDNWSRVNNQICTPNIFNVSNLIEDKQYEFRVYAENEAGMSKPSMASTSVKIKDPDAAILPEFVTGLRKSQCVAGKTARFEVEITGTPKPDVTWFKGSRELFDDNKYEITNDGNHYSMAIRDVFGEDQDEYSVRAVNKGGSRSSRADLEIRSPPKVNVPARFKDVSTFEKGEPVVLKIPFTGNPKPSVRWVRDGQDVRGKDYSEEVGERHAVLTINHATKEHDGPFRIVLENDLGTDEAVIKIQINDRPDPPRFPVAENIREDSVVLSWKPPMNDGGSFITGYVIEKCEPPSQHWVRIASTRMAFHNVTSLQSNKEYQFRVAAENLYGLSEPCEPTATIKTDDAESKKKKHMEDEFGRKIRGKGPKISDYDKFYEDLWKKYVPQPVTVKQDNIYDYYDILEELGSGAFGVVHRCVEKKTGRVFVAKFINTPYPLDKATVRNEINVMNQTHHPKLLTLHDAFEDKYEMILVLEFLAGGELFDRIAADDYKMNEAEVINYIRQVCDGLRHMHENSIVHLDIKPENVMCETKKSTGVKIIDFGLATKLNPDEKVKVTTATAEFAAPEIVDREHVGFYTDMWAVGVLAYVLLSGLSPFAGEDDLETLQNVSMCDWEFAEEAFSSISPEAKDFIRKLLVKQPTRRMTVHECLDHAWLKGDLSDRQTRIPSSRYDKIRARIAQRYADWPAPMPAIGRIANYSSLRKHRPKEYNIYDAYFDRKEAIPKFIRRPRNVVVGENQSARIDCKVIAASPPIITWHFNDNQLTQSIKYMQKYMGKEYQLKVSRCKAEDKGEYIVIAQNSFGRREEKATISVESLTPLTPMTPSRSTTPMRRMSRAMSEPPEPPKDEPPKFSFDLRPRLIQSGSDFKLICCVQAQPAPKVTWYKNGVALVKDRHYSIFYSTGVASLEVLSARVDDSGRYTCEAINELGKVETSSKITVEDRACHEDITKGSALTSSTSRMVRRTTGGHGTDESSSYRSETSSSTTTSNSRSSRRVIEEVSEDSSSYSSKRSERMKSKEETPSFEKNLEAKTLNEGDRLKFSCSIKGKPEPEVEWFLNGKKLISDSLVSIKNIAGICTLTIASVTEDDEGTYLCKVTNRAGEASSKATLKVNAKTKKENCVIVDPPRFLSHPLGLCLVDGDATTLECRLSGSPDVTWYRGKEKIVDSEDFRYERAGDVYKLVIVEVFPEDSDIYRIEARNSAGTASSSFSIRVDVPEETPVGPVFQSFPHSQSVDEGKSVQFSCPIKDAETVLWSKDGRTLDDTGRFKISQSGSSFSFEIPAALVTDSGVYCVEAKSGKGTCKGVFTLTVA
ncbi:twitchin-like isoform X8 [Mizuhopecten yessoensis]|nr:twitchin-like isoform X8 [Mizuhopecten yessoensis]